MGDADVQKSKKTYANKEQNASKSFSQLLQFVHMTPFGGSYIIVKTDQMNCIDIPGV